MRISSLFLRQYRNISAHRFEFPKNLNIFVGNNGQGKTNILESIVYLSSSRSFRVNDDKVLIQHNQPFSEISATIEQGRSDVELRFVLSEAGKYLTLNGTVVKKLSEIMGQCNVVLFNPDDLNFFTFAPRKRRREIDFELGKLSHDYVDLLSKANKILLERNVYLKQRSVDMDYLDILTQQLLAVSILIMEKRYEFSLTLQDLIRKHYQILSDSDDLVSFEYRSPVSVDASMHDALKRKMTDSLQRDRDFKMTHVGVHRDDYTFKINGVPVVDVSSQGQRRMLILAYKFALVDLVKQQQGYYPILCLDDLFSELDETRRKRVLEFIDDDMQVFISTTDLSFIQTAKDLDVFSLKAGSVHKEVI